MYNEQLANRVRELLQDQAHVAELNMMGGLVFMVDDKMCVGVLQDELMIRIAPDVRERLLEQNKIHEMNMHRKPMRTYALVAIDDLAQQADLQYWLGLALEYNKVVKPSKKKKIQQ
ncbi:hypothetical protein BH09BAC1_BH09BAC1_05350 [soil metagenome]